MPYKGKIGGVGGLTSPDDDVRHAVEVILRIVQIDCVFQSNASRDTGKHTQAQQKGDGDLGVTVELDIPQQDKGTRSLGQRYTHTAQSL